MSVTRSGSKLNTSYREVTRDKRKMLLLLFIIFIDVDKVTYTSQEEKGMRRSFHQLNLFDWNMNW